MTSLQKLEGYLNTRAHYIQCSGQSPCLDFYKGEGQGYNTDTFINAQLVWAELIGSHGGGCFTIIVLIGGPHSRQTIDSAGITMTQKNLELLSASRDERINIAFCL